MKVVAIVALCMVSISGAFVTLGFLAGAFPIALIGVVVLVVSARQFVTAITWRNK